MAEPRDPELSSSGPPFDPNAATLPPPGNSEAEADPYAATISPEPSGQSPSWSDATLPPPEGYEPPEADSTLVSSQQVPPAPGVIPIPQIPGYQLLRELGRGGMGVVYHAVHTHLHRPVALKMILAGEFAGADARVRFLSEAEVIARLQHPNIVQLYEFNVHNGVPYFSLEYVDGGTLDKKLDHQPLPDTEAAALIETLARAVEYAHSLGIVHRDLKPGNILLQLRPAPASGSGPASGSHPQNRSGHGDSSFGTLSCVVRELSVIPKITDFGLAKSATNSSGLTQSGAIMGTPSYMAPEQAGGHSRDVGAPADIYALGAILYECLTGRPPFRAATPLDTVLQVLNEEPVPPKRLQSKVSKDLETICLKCLHKDPQKRYESAAALADDLGRFLRGESILARPVGFAERSIRWARRHPSAAALVAVTSLAGFIILLGGWVTSARLGTALTEAREQRTLAEMQRTEADRLRILAETHAEEADRQRQEVAKNLNKRLQLVDDILFNMDGRLANLSGMDSVRREFLDDVRKFSDQLVLENPNDPDVLRQAGRVYKGIGELSRSARDFREADAAYTKAIDYCNKLLAREPDRVEYLNDLGLATVGRASMNWLAKKHKEAFADYEASLRQFEKISVLKPADPQPRMRVARYAFYQANILEQLDQHEQGIAKYREALSKQEKLLADFPKQAELHENHGNTATGLALALEKSNPDEAVSLLMKAKASFRKVVELDSGNESYSDKLNDARDDLYALCQRLYRHADLATLAREYLSDHADSPNGAYNAGCYFALAARTALQCPTLSPAERTRFADEYSRLAIEHLDLSLERGFTDRAHLLKDRDLDGLRERKDYREFLTRMEQRFPGRPVTPADLLASFKEEFTNEHHRYRASTQSAFTVAEHARARRQKPDFAAFASRALKLAEQNPESPVHTEALIWIVDTAGYMGVNQKDVRVICEDAIQRLSRCLDRPEFANACRILGETRTDGATKLLNKAASEHKQADVRGLAAYFLAQSLAQQAESAPPGTAVHDSLNRQAENQLEAVIKNYATVPFQDSTLGALANRKLYEIRSVSVGRQARDIAGTTLDGKEMSLADTRGKVTLVLFWANWCGFCRQMYPAIQEWYGTKYQGKPFTIVGVNCDEDRSTAQRAVTREKLPFPSWWDGGTSGTRATQQWLVDSYPSVFLLDHQGIIQKKWVGKPENDEVESAINSLLRRVPKLKN